MGRVAHVDPLSWVAGVLDARGRFAIRTHDGEPFAAIVDVSCSQDMGELLSKATGVGEWKKGKWSVKAEDQERFLAGIIPYLRVKFPEASKAYRWRLTAPKRRMGWKVTKAVAAYRKSLVDSVRNNSVGKPSSDSVPTAEDEE